MKYKKQFVVSVSACLLAFFSASSFAQTDHATPDAAHARDTVAKVLEAQGIAVATDAYGPSIMQFYTGGDSVVLTFKEGGADVSINGNPVSGHLNKAGRRLSSGRRGSRLGVANAGPTDDVNVVECILISVNVYTLKLDLCEFDTSGVDVLCVPAATFDFALNTLRCVSNVGDGPA
jgi:hypothetical protein